MTNEMTTVKVTKANRDRLKQINPDKSINDIITELIENQPGMQVDDVITIDRDPVALTLKYWEILPVQTFDDEIPSKIGDIKTRDVTYKELHQQPVGTKFMANPVTPGENYFHSTAEIVSKSQEDIILRVSEVSNRQGIVDVLNSVVHIRLF